MIGRTSGLRRGRRDASRLAARAGGGFTLIETAMATVIIGVGVVAMVEAQQSFIQSNDWSSQAAVGTYLANEIRELTRRYSSHDPVTGLYLDDGVLVGWGPETGEITVEDFDDLDDLDGMRFGATATCPDRWRASGQVIPQLDLDGDPVSDEGGEPVSMQGWAQSIIVEKLDPYDTGTVRADEYSEPAAGSFQGRAVDAFPIRVTVVVDYARPGEDPAEVVRMSWIVP